MKIISRLKGNFPKPANALLAVLSAILLILAYPGFEFWILAHLALIPLFWTIEREKESWIKSLILGWIFGTIFFFGTCWWLTFAPITYAGFPAVLAYFLLFCATIVVGFFPAIFSALFSILLKRFGSYAILAAPFLWTAVEFSRFWLTGNNWNAIGYSQAFEIILIQPASIGGVFLVSFFVVLLNTLLFLLVAGLITRNKIILRMGLIVSLFSAILIFSYFVLIINTLQTEANTFQPDNVKVVAIQPNVPMSGLNDQQWFLLRQRHIELAETALQKLEIGGQGTKEKGQIIVIFPESPMNFMYARDEEFREFLRGFASKNNVNVLFNSAEPNAKGDRFHNSAVMVNERGEKIVQYDKIHLMPFGEYMPLSELVGQILPPMVGNFAFGEEYDLVPLGEAQAGVMICFESHFPGLSNEFVRSGADALIEITNDGYLGNTPVLHQHLANAVFRAVETNRPVLRVTNVGITAFINERGEVLDAADVYTEATKIWTVGKSDGRQTVYVKYGDWFAVLCLIISLGLLFLTFLKNSRNNGQNTQR